jgi:hypothetical protein
MLARTTEKKSGKPFLENEQVMDRRPQTMNIGIYLNPETYKKIETQAAVKYLSMSDVVRQVMGEALKKVTGESEKEMKSEEYYV